MNRTHTQYRSHPYFLPRFHSIASSPSIPPYCSLSYSISTYHTIYPISSSLSLIIPITIPIGIVKLMGRSSGFIAVHATLASGIIIHPFFIFCVLSCLPSYLPYFPSSSLPTFLFFLLSSWHLTTHPLPVSPHPLPLLFVIFLILCYYLPLLFLSIVIAPITSLITTPPLVRTLLRTCAGDVDLCLVPEVAIELEGENGCLPFLMQRIAEQGHAVVVVAEGGKCYAVLCCFFSFLSLTSLVPLSSSCFCKNPPDPNSTIFILIFIYILFLSSFYLNTSFWTRLNITSTINSIYHFLLFIFILNYDVL